MTPRPRRPPRALLLAVFASGACGLSWELLWQHYTGLSLGVSAHGAATTLCAVMAGLGLGGLLAVRLAQRGWLRRPLLAFGVAEAAIGIGGLLIPGALGLLATLDTRAYGISPAAAELAQVPATVAVLLLPAIAMGTTIPILAPYVERRGLSVAIAYALNILGAVAGVLVATFAALPVLGVARTALATAAINLGVAVWAIARREAPSVAPAEARSRWPRAPVSLLAFASGFCVFALEVSWFRSIRAAVQATTESFALLLAAFLLSLAAGSWLAPRLRARFPTALAAVVPLAGLAVLCATPAVDNLDRWTVPDTALSWSPFAFSWRVAGLRFGWILGLTLLPVTLLGIIFPWLLTQHATTTGTGRLYAINTLGAVAGALVAGFALLPWIGATRTSWLAGLAVLGAAPLWSRSWRVFAGAVVAGAVGIAVAHHFGQTSGRLRVQGYGADTYLEVDFVSEGPDSTVWVTRSRRTGAPLLVIDGFIASSERPGTNYMKWMGHLPALAAPALGETLVICFGTGQTADAVRQHSPASLDVVDVSEGVFEAADFFPSNHGVLEDPRVRRAVMDGRAFLRRQTDRRYDLVTLEPMPPNFASSNSLYSSEFYALIAARLAPGGVVAQWVPFHLLATGHMRAIVATFRAAFPYTRLWIDPEGGTGVLVGARRPWQLQPARIALPLSEREIERAFELGWDEVAALAQGAELITDDNQLLSYGYERFARAPSFGPTWSRRLAVRNLAIVRSHRGTPRAAGDE